jgi:DNA repair photolyase
MKRFGNLKPIRLDEKEFDTDLGKGNYIFVGSSNDMFQERVPDEWIYKTLDHCLHHNEGNKYLFQSKNPKRFLENFIFPDKVILATTIESNRNYSISSAPKIEKRAEAMCLLREGGYKTMITIEPILDFELNELLIMLYFIKPDIVTIGANCDRDRDISLAEPSPEKIKELIDELGLLNIKVKKNLRRIC